MPVWLLAILNMFAPIIVKWAIHLLEKKYPGLGDILKTILDYIDSHPNPPVAVNDLRIVADGLELKKNT